MLLLFSKLAGIESVANYFELRVASVGVYPSIQSSRSKSHRNANSNSASPTVEPRSQQDFLTMPQYLDLAGHVGLVVRGKTSRAHTPGLMSQHADCVLTSGEPVGFYGEGNGRVSNSSGLSMQGIVYRYDLLLQRRQEYVVMDTAKKYELVSGVLLISVTGTEAELFTQYWDKLTNTPGGFDIVGDNCSSHASAGFIHAGILKNGIPGLDTPDNLFRQLCAKRNCKQFFGFLGFTRSDGGFCVDLEETTEDAKNATSSSAPTRSSQSQSSGLPSSLNSSNTGSRVSSGSSSNKR